MTNRDFNLWTQADAIAFVRICERHAPDFGFHVALTGGTLWGCGESKDCDVVIYRELYHKAIFNPFGFFDSMAKNGLKLLGSGNPWSVQAEWLGKSVDFFIPEYKDVAQQPVDPLPLPPKFSKHSS